MKKLLTFYLCCVALFVSGKAHLTEEEIDELISIAEANKERSSVMAKGVLCFFYGICYEKEFNIDTDISMSPKKFATSEPPTSVNTEIKVFPNPTDGNLTVFIPELPEGTTVFQLFDVMGRNILFAPLTENNNTINLSKFLQGIYHYRIMNNDIAIGNGKVVKQ